MVKHSRVQGGDKEVDLEMDFRLKNTKDFSTQSEENVFCLRGKFRDADIENELILGYPWLEENGLNICPAQDALACGLQNEILLGGWSAPPRKSKNRNVWMIRRMNMYIDGEDEDIDADDSWYEDRNENLQMTQSSKELKQESERWKLSKFAQLFLRKANGVNISRWWNA